MSSARGSDARIIVIGGGVAGLSAAALLAPHRPVVLLEREPLLASQASGNNAAIHRPLEHDVYSAELARRSRELLETLIGPEVLSKTGLILLSRDAEVVRALAAIAVEAHVRHTVLSGAALCARVPSLRGGEAQHGLLLHDGGVLDLHRLTTGLAQTARAHGAELRTNIAVRALDYDAVARRMRGVVLDDGTHMRASHVVLAAGAWSAELAAAAGFPLPLTPLRRHLLQLTAAGSPPPPTEAVVWRLEDEVYFRPESQGVLASPCDETPWAAERAPLTEPAALLDLAHKLERTAPSLASARVRRAWACLRTFAPDRELVVGSDPRAQGLHWLAALGGRGMSVAPAAAEMLASELLGDDAIDRTTLPHTLRSARLID
jgi:D-arginine dehydrogenase